jgi:hypothetical protein
MNDRIKELAEQAGFVVGVSANADRQIKLFAELVRQDEREACAKVCDDHFGWTPRMIGETIRERGQA